MGSIVLAGRENAIIDGQQRFSSLTLLLSTLLQTIMNGLPRNILTKTISNVGEIASVRYCFFIRASMQA